jgi:molybdopterin-guanine dinucleotide biosynthesis protein A
MATGLILAGGRSQRFGSEKAAARLQGSPLLVHAFRRLMPHCRLIGVSAPRLSQAAQLAVEIGAALVRDPPNAPSGPLSGVAAGLAWTQREGEDLMLTVPCDAPLLPDDLAPRLLAAVEGRDAAVARTADGLQPLCTVWRTTLLEPVVEALARGEHPAVRQVLMQARAAEVTFDDAGAFINVNTPDELARAEQRLRARG